MANKQYPIPQSSSPSGGSGTVSTTGSPANGNLTQFSGASSITNGDLSGVVTTAGTLTTAFASSTGSGAVVLATSPALTTPSLGVATATSVNKVVLTAPSSSATLTISNSKTLSITNSLTFSGTDSTTHTFPPVTSNVDGTIASVDLTGQSSTLTGQSIIASVPATAIYMITLYEKVTTAATNSSTLGGSTGTQILYTDGVDSTSRTITISTQTLAGVIATGASANTAGAGLVGQVNIYAKAGTAVTANQDYTSSGATAMQYEWHVRMVSL